jgi:hypothetical protein
MLTLIDGAHPRTSRLRQRIRSLVRTLPLFAGILCVLTICGGAPQLLGLWLLIVLAALVPAVSGTICGVIVAVNVSVSLAQERRKNRYELLSITPLGPEGVNWTIAQIIYFRSEFMRFVFQFVTGGYVFVLASVTFVIFLTLFSGSFVLMAFTWMYGLIALFYYDLTGAIVIGVISGLLASTYSRDGATVRTTAISLVLGAQMALYLPVAMLISVAPPAPVTPFLIAGVFILLREGIFSALVRWVSRRGSMLLDLKAL